MTDLETAIQCVPSGPWAVGVSGGADSVALLRLLRPRPDLSLHVCHLNHQTRGNDSDLDAAFVANVAAELNLPCTVMLRSDLEQELVLIDPNPSARYRIARLALFRRVVKIHRLHGVLLAHHAGDQAETVLQRLLRGVGPSALAGMSSDERLGTLRMVRPLLGVFPGALRASLHGHAWREDSSNTSPAYLRNRLRVVLNDPGLQDALQSMAVSFRHLRTWSEQQAPVLSERFSTAALADLPPPLGRAAARRWLRDRGVPPDRIDAATADRLIALAADLATPHQQQFPGTLTVRRKAGIIWSPLPARNS